jgi:hypothetical protein
MRRNSPWALVLIVSMISLPCTWVQGQEVVSNVPVFRYALQDWDTDLYNVYVFYKGDLDAQSGDLIGRIRDAREIGANLSISSIEVSEMDGKIKTIHDQAKIDRYPSMVVRFPNTEGPEGTAWAGMMTNQTMDALLASAGQKEIIKRLLAGDSVVWVLVEGGKKSDDDAAFKALQQHISKAQNQLKSKMKMNVIQSDSKYNFDVGVPLKLKFSAIRISRKSPSDGVLAETLLGTDQLTEYADEGNPVAFAVFGRGRVLPGVVTLDDIKDGQAILEACQELAGPLLDERKENTGRADLPLVVNWTQSIKRKKPPVPVATGGSATDGSTTGGTTGTNPVPTTSGTSDGTSNGSATGATLDGSESTGTTDASATGGTGGAGSPATNGAVTPVIAQMPPGEPNMILASILVLFLLAAPAVVGLSLKQPAKYVNHLIC